MAEAAASARAAYSAVDIRLRRAVGPNAMLEAVNDIHTVQGRAPLDMSGKHGGLDVILTQLYAGRAEQFSMVDRRGIIDRMRDQLARVPMASNAPAAVPKSTVPEPDFFDPALQAEPPQRDILRLLLELPETWKRLALTTDAAEMAAGVLLKAGAIQIREEATAGGGPNGLFARLTVDGARWQAILRSGDAANAVKVRGLVLTFVWDKYREQRAKDQQATPTNGPREAVDTNNPPPATPTPAIPETDEGEGAAPTKPRRKSIPKDEAEVLVRKWLAKNAAEDPAAVTRDEIAKATGVSAGGVSKTAAWQAFSARRDAEAKPAPREVLLSDAMQAAIPADCETPAELAALIEEQKRERAEEERRHERRHRSS